MPIADLQKVLGHKKNETTLKYIHAVNNSLRETMLRRKLDAQNFPLLHMGVINAPVCNLLPRDQIT